MSEKDKKKKEEKIKSIEEYRIMLEQIGEKAGFVVLSAKTFSDGRQVFSIKRV